VDFEDRKDGSCGVTYQVTEPGNCDWDLKLHLLAKNKKKLDIMFLWIY
jgi:hypothetical protein